MLVDTYNTHSLKLLEENPQEFKKKYIDKTAFIHSAPEAEEGKKFHALISYYFKGFDISKFENVLDETEKAIWEKLKTSDMLKKNYVAVEHSFLIKEKSFFLNGRFDAVYKENDSYTVVDWKMKTLPKDPEEDLQSVVYLYCAGKIFDTENISMLYFSLTTHERAFVKLSSPEKYLERIEKIIASI